MSPRPATCETNIGTRSNPGTSFRQMVNTGYMSEAHVIELAEKAGFKLVARSEVNANAKDTKDHPNGVWTLPPTSRGRIDAENIWRLAKAIVSRSSLRNLRL